MNFKSQFAKFMAQMKIFSSHYPEKFVHLQSSESKGRRAAAQSAQSEGSSSSELDDQIEKDRYLSSVSARVIKLGYCQTQAINNFLTQCVEKSENAVTSLTLQ